jgi:acylpyruvate hydrolase
MEASDAMRLATLDDERGGSCAAVLVDGAFAPVRAADGSVYLDVGALLRAGEDGWRDADVAQDGGGSDALEPGRLRRPVVDPGAVVCVGHNYRRHLAEMGRDVPEHPTLFGKLARALTDPYADVRLPRCSASVDYEGELAVVIGAGGRDIAVTEAWDAVAGLTVLNDVTMRDYQRRTIQWFAGKNFQASTPVGPWLVTPDELADLATQRLTVAVNGDPRQETVLGDLLFDVPTLVSDISSIMRLEPGDLIATGTPGGVGHAMDPPRYLGDGDVVEVEIQGIGQLRTRFRAD